MNSIGEFRYGDVFPCVHFTRDSSGTVWYEGGPVAKIAGFIAHRDAVLKVSEEHKRQITGSEAARIANNPQTKRLTLIDAGGVKQILYRSQKISADFIAGFLAALAKATVQEQPTLFDAPKPPIAPIPESLPAALPTPKIVNSCQDDQRPSGAGYFSGAEAPTAPPGSGVPPDVTQTLEEMNRQITELQSKLMPHYSPHRLYTPSEVGKRFGMSAVAINKVLQREGVQYTVRKNNHSIWLLNKPYRNRGLAITKNVEKNGHLIEHLFWTTSGVAFVENVLLKIGIHPTEPTDETPSQ